MTSLCKRALLAGLGALSLSAAAFAQYPNKPIKIIVPFLAGGTTDIMARAVAADLQKAFGQAVVVALAATSAPTRWPNLRRTATRS
jgi:tripartite-type tricarboxylate transporter receptor subunit TctC